MTLEKKLQLGRAETNKDTHVNSPMKNLNVFVSLFQQFLGLVNTLHLEAGGLVTSSISTFKDRKSGKSAREGERV
jgi:hypothetical protein